MASLGATFGERGDEFQPHDVEQFHTGTIFIQSSVQDRSSSTPEWIEGDESTSPQTQFHHQPQQQQQQQQQQQ